MAKRKVETTYKARLLGCATATEVLNVYLEIGCNGSLKEEEFNRLHIMTVKMLFKLAQKALFAHVK